MFKHTTTFLKSECKSTKGIVCQTSNLRYDAKTSPTTNFHEIRFQLPLYFDFAKSKLWGLWLCFNNNSGCPGC